MVAKIYAAESPVLETRRILKSKLNPLRVNLIKLQNFNASILEAIANCQIFCKCTVQLNLCFPEFTE